MTISPTQIEAIRAALSEMDPKSSASAAEPIPVEQLYTPATHASALDPSRTLVVGNRGVGKSVWSGVLADEKTRIAVAPSYPRLGLDHLTVSLGFHEGAGRTGDMAPSTRVLSSLLDRGSEAEEIWEAVLLRAVSGYIGTTIPESLGDTIAWVAADVERAEATLGDADNYFRSRDSQFLLVFDALDRLATSWEKIRPLSQGILRLALSMNGFHAMRAKVFMRTDQAKDDDLFRFPDASKMRASRVELAWHATELYGLLFGTLWRNDRASDAFHALCQEAIRRNWAGGSFEDPADQTAIFTKLAGEFMGSDHRRGRTYSWVIDHLADAFHETTPRSFLITIQRAANARAKPTTTVIDHYGIREGVQQASEVRVSQLQEDYPWIRTVLEDLEGLEVPCTPSNFTRRWSDRSTVDSITSITETNQRPGPLELERSHVKPEAALLEALKNIGVVEERSEDRINMPDIFRVAAKIKRRGGVRPPVGGSRHSR
jgi:hypothetical protein